MNEQLARERFDAARAYVSEHSAEELEWVRGITPELFERMNRSEFLGEYCWVVYASGFRVSVLSQKFGRLTTAYCDFDIDRICHLQSLDAALAVINNRRKAEGFVEGCRRIRSEGFELFKTRVKAEGIDALQSLPFIGSITKKHLARNIGLLDVSKDDVHLVRVARELGALSVEELTAFLAKEFGEKQGVVDLILWRFCADGAWDEWRTDRTCKQTPPAAPSVPGAEFSALPQGSAVAPVPGANLSGDSRINDEVITCERIDELLRFFPLLGQPDKKLEPKWHGLEGRTGEEGVITMPYPSYPSEVEEFFRLAGQPWWSDRGYDPETAGKMLADDALVALASLSQIKTMLTFCVRGERFCDGHWGAVIREGRVGALLRRLQHIREIIA
jgi:hypothetical protein